jgi:hypothetical protein
MMNPRPGQNVFYHPLARMLPLHRYQSQVYHLAEKFPVGFEDGFTPIWEAVPFSLGARQTQQARVNVQREFHLVAIAGSSSAAGGFRWQFYDQKKKRKLTDRGISFNVLGTGTGGYQYLREPYPLTEKNAQVLVIVQNQDTVTNNIQIVLYGMARRFNFPA